MWKHKWKCILQCGYTPGGRNRFTGTLLYSSMRSTSAFTCVPPLLPSPLLALPSFSSTVIPRTSCRTGVSRATAFFRRQEQPRARAASDDRTRFSGSKFVRDSRMGEKSQTILLVIARIVD